MSIFADFALLGRLLNSHEAIIHKRWLKKSNVSRCKVLQEAWPSKMASNHRPEFDALEKEDERKRCSNTDYRDEYLMPYINEEDLSRSHSLLLLMSARGRCHPNELAPGDHDASNMGRRILTLRSRWLVNYRMDLTGSGIDESYGQLRDRHTHPDKWAALSSHLCSFPSDGMLVLEVQERILSFLVRCVKLILHDYTEEELLRRPLQTPASLTLGTDEEFTSLANMSAEAPYRAPAKLDLARIATLLAAKRDDVADHYWSLREDPGYFEARMLEAKEHLPETVKDASGKGHMIFRRGGEDLLWERVVLDQIAYSQLELGCYSALQAQAESLRDMQRSYADVIDPGVDLPGPFTDAIVTFRYYLIRGCEGPLKLLELGFAGSPSMRPYHCRSSEPSPANLPRSHLSS